LARGTCVEQTGLHFAAAQAVLDHVGNLADLGLLHDQRFGAEQAERWRVGVAHVAAGHQLALVEAAFRIDLLLVGAEGADFFFGQEFELGDADAVLAGNDSVQSARQMHDAFDRPVRRLQHLVVVGVDRDVGMHVAVAGVHVQRDEDAAAQHFLVDRLDALDDRPIDAAVEDLGQAAFNSCFHDVRTE
jgi:hypothetical protein